VVSRWIATIVEKLEASRPVASFQRHSVSEAIDNIRALRKGNFLGGLKIKDLVEEGRKY
jgi:hypothetical protein